MADLWPDEFGKPDLTPPRAILREQASGLTKKTRGALEGLVVTSPTAHNQNEFTQTFYLLVPDLDNYRYRLLDVMHPLEFYPLEIQADVLGKRYRCSSEKEFTEKLKDIFNAPETKKIIRAILAQVEEPAQS